MSSPPRSPRICVTATSGPPDRGLGFYLIASAGIPRRSRGGADGSSGPPTLSPARDKPQSCLSPRLGPSFFFRAEPPRRALVRPLGLAQRLLPAKKRKCRRFRIISALTHKPDINRPDCDV